MKKFIIIIASLVTLFLVATIIIPVIFSDDIQSGIRRVLDDNLEAQVYYDAAKFDLTLFKSFPNPTAALADFGIIGLDEFSRNLVFKQQSGNLQSFLICIGKHTSCP